MSAYYIGELKDGYFEKYGVCWSKEFKKGNNPYLLELTMFREKMANRMDRNLGDCNPQYHFKRLARAFWPEKDFFHPVTEKRTNYLVKFIWTEWADKMLDALCENKYLSIAGPAGCGKSEICAIWVIINWLCEPSKTLCMVTSTSYSAARQRIWGKVVKYWAPLEKMGWPGKLIDSRGTIVYVTKDGPKDEKTQGDLAGIFLIAGEKKREKEALGKMIGLHQDTVIFVADELPELSEAIPEAAWSNLASGTTVRFQFVGVGNPKSYSDAFGLFAKPKLGWESITVDDEEWETEMGICLHFDTLKNPNILAGKKIYPWMHTQEDIEAIPESKRNSSVFWRMFRGFWCPTGEEDSIYSEIEIIMSKSDQPVVWLDDKWIPCAALDPAFTNGGDRPMAVFGRFGRNMKGLNTLCVTGSVEIEDNVNDKEHTFSEQIINKFRKLCEERQISPRHIAYDNTGAGISFGHLMSMVWSKDILKVDFGGAASDLPVSAYDSTPAKERYVNRVTELWYGVKEYLRTNQIRGIHPSLMREMCARKKSEEKGQFGLRFRVEAKKEMKIRTQQSPDESDGFMLLAELCRQRMGFNSNEGTKYLPQNQNAPSGKSWKDLFNKKKSVFKPYEPGEQAA